MKLYSVKRKNLWKMVVISEVMMKDVNEFVNRIVYEYYGSLFNIFIYKTIK